MKVNVKVKHIPQTILALRHQVNTLNAALESAYEQNEVLFQENKDLRVREGHLQDELKQLKSRFATACANRDNWEASFAQVTSWWEQSIATKNKAENEACALRDALNDRNARVDELEQRNQWLENQATLLQSQKRDLYQQINEAQRRADENWSLYQTQLSCNNELNEEMMEMSENLASAHETIETQNETIKNLNVQVTLKPKFNNLWNLLEENGLIVDTGKGLHNAT